MIKFFTFALVALVSMALPETGQAREIKQKWTRSVASGNFDQDTSFYWIKPAPQGGCYQDDYFTVKVVKKPKHGTFRAHWVTKMLTSGPCAGSLVNAYQFTYTPKRRPKKDKVVIKIGSLDRLPNRKDVDSAKIEIKIRKK